MNSNHYALTQFYKFGKTKPERRLSGFAIVGQFMYFIAIDVLRQLL